MANNLSRLFCEEQSILDLTELICKIMNQKGIGRRELAQRMGWTKEYLDEWLDGSKEMIITEASSILFYLGYDLCFAAKPRTNGDLT